MTLLFLSFLAGILTVLAPCSFMLLPVIIGGSVQSNTRIRVYLIIGSLAASLFGFSLLLKLLTLPFSANPMIINYITGTIIVLVGLVTLFPGLWDSIQIKLGLSNRSDKLLNEAEKKGGHLGAILTGASLGPVFSSCSPTYAFIISTVLRENLAVAIANMAAYIFGLSGIMLLVAIYGQKFTRNFSWAVNPNGIFKKVIAILFVIVGIAIFTGTDRAIQSRFAQLPLVGQFEQRLLGEVTGRDTVTDSDQILNVEPYPAPEFEGIDSWINSQPLTQQELEGEVVLVEFWTYSCINCFRAAAYLNEWYDQYKDDGFTVIGVHTPEFTFEKDPRNVQNAIDRDYGFEFPVALDNNYTTWDNYENSFWPAKYLIDAEGNVRYRHFGEGDYDDTERAIQTLLGENGVTEFTDLVSSDVDTRGKFGTGQTPELYLSGKGKDDFGNPEGLRFFTDFRYNKPENLEPNKWGLEGAWRLNPENIECISDCTLLLNFTAKDVYAVANPSSVSDDNSIQVELNSEVISESSTGSDITSGTLIVDEQRLYHLVSLSQQSTNQLLELEAQPGQKFLTFTFGS